MIKLLLHILANYPRTALALILAMLFIGISVFIAIVKSVSILALTVILGLFCVLLYKGGKTLRLSSLFRRK